MFFIYREAPSNGARELAQALEGRRVRSAQLLAKMKPSDVLVCWGSTITHPRGGRVLNGAAGVSKLTELRTLREAGVRTVEFTPYTVGTPVPAGWLGRSRNHTEGNDLFNPPARPDFLVRRETFVREYRIHSFRGRSIRAGVKVPREGMAQHEWIRNWTGGWRLAYDGKSAKQRHRDAAHAAVTALGLDFGAVDIGERADKSVVVLEVNRAPGIEGTSPQVYAQAMQEWLQAQ